MTLGEFTSSLKAFNSRVLKSQINVYKAYTNLISIAEAFGGVKTKRELAMFLTQIMWESDGLCAKEEYACVKTKCPGQYVSQEDYLYPGRNFYGKFLK